MMQGSSHQIIPLFDGEKYDFWSIKMSTIFKTRKIWSVVEEGVSPEPVQGEITPETERERKKREEMLVNDMIALQILQTSVSDQIFSRIATARTSKEAWDSLKAEYEGSPQVQLVKLQTLRREYENLKMHDNEDIKTFTDKLIELESQLTSHGERKSGYQLIQKILISLPAKFDSIVSVMEQTRDLNLLTMTELIGILKAHEARTKIREEGPNEGAFMVHAKKKVFDFKQRDSKNRSSEAKNKRWCDYCKRSNHTEDKCFKKQRDNGQKKDDYYKNQKSNKECYNCGRIGHFASVCRAKKKEKAHLSFEEEDPSDEHSLFSAIEDAQTYAKRDVWLIDSGCTNHMTNEERYFDKIDKSITVPIRVGNGEIVMTKGKGDISVITNNGKRIIKDVFLVPKLARNLLSVPQMVASGYQVIFAKDKCIIQDKNDKSIMSIPMTHKSYRVIWNSVGNEAMVAKEQVEETWHRRLGHVSNKRLQHVQEKDMVIGLPKFKVSREVCEACNLGKQARKSFPKESSTKSKERLDLIHTDVCGPMKTESLDGSRYMVVFLDDFTHMTWVYFLKQKSEAFSMFKKFKSMAEKQSQCVIKSLRSDGGGEFVSQEFNRFCEEEGIVRQISLPYSPQQNGKAERMNRSLIEMARSMIEEQKLPHKFWAEAVYTASYIQNRLYTKAVDGEETPIERWNGHKPNVSHLRIFGCICYVHIPDEKRKKLDAKSKKGVFVGYSNKSKGYRVFLLENQRIDISRDVVFDESKYWDWQKKEDVKKHIMLSVDDQTEKQSNAEQDRGDERSERINQFLNEESTEQRRDESDQSREFSHMKPKRFKSINEIIQITPEVDLEETAQVIESCFLVHEEPICYGEACEFKEWNEAMDEEIMMIERNRTWKLVEKPEGKNIITTKWIYKLKTDMNGVPIKHKARLVARGFSQEFGIDYSETFAPVSRYDTIRSLFAFASQMQWKLYQMDVKSAFLNGDLNEEIYVSQPDGYVARGQEEKVLRLYKALYGLKQAPRAWYDKIDGYFLENGFTRSSSDAALYILKEGNDVLIVSLYVDDIIITGTNEEKIRIFKKNMKTNFEMTDLGLLNHFLGMEVIQEEDGVFLSQTKYASKLLDRFGMRMSKSVNTPLTPQRKRREEDKIFHDATKYRSIVGGLLYLCASRPDIMFSSSYLSRYMSAPMERHYLEAKHVLRYVKGTLDFGVKFTKVECPRLVGYSDSDWGGSLEDKKSTTGYTFSFGSGMFCWQSCKQQTVAQSTAEAEYMALCAATNQSIWLRRLFEEFGMKIEESIPIYCDNKSAIAIGKNPVQHKRTKHIDIKYHFVREAIGKELIQVEYCKGDDQLADVFTKNLSLGRFEDLRSKLGVLRRFDSRRSIED